MSTRTRYDAIVLGVGGVGSAALLQLARRGTRVLGIDRFAPGHDRGSSHGKTRLIRQAYYEHPDYVPLVQRAFMLWHELEQLSGETLYYQVGLLQIGPPQGEIIQGVRASARQHTLPIEELSRAETAKRFPGFHVPDGYDAIFETRAGYLLVERCVTAQVEQAVRLGAEIHGDETIRAWRAEGKGAVVETDRAAYHADRLIISAGAWASQLLSDLRIPFEVRRKPLYWWQTRSDVYRADRGCPGFFFDLPHGSFYGFPQIDDLGIKTAEHSGGGVVADPLCVSRELDRADQQRVGDFVEKYLPQTSGHCTDHATCMYTMTPDAHFVVDRHPTHPQVVFAAGLSGHGFKFTCTLGETLSQLALDGQSTLPIGFLSANRPSLQTKP